jgi:hypothetical protein
MGGGDVMGAQIEELRRSGAEKSNKWGSIGRTVGAVVPGVIATILSSGNPIIGGLVASLGSTIFGAVGDLMGIGDEKKANEMATSEAYAKLWERQAPSAMGLTALLGKYGGTDAENTRVLRNTWEYAANTATGYGFSPEEGVEQVKQAAYQGLNEGQALDAARDVFAFERGTGADRGALAEFRSRTERFTGASDGLNKAWQGNQASGMATAQFNEFLRSMQRTFEDGISKGFVRGAGEIAGNFAFLADLNGGSKLWKGEQGAARLSQMNAGIEATTSLSSVNDILSFRGAQKLLDKWDARGTAGEKWKSIGNLDGNEENGLELNRGYDYIDTMVLLERGLTPDLFHSQMQVLKSLGESRSDTIERMRGIYGLNYGGSAALYEAYNKELKGKTAEEAEQYFSGAEWAKKLESFKDNPDYNNSTELTMFEAVAEIKKYTYDIGQWHLDQKIPTLAQELVKAWKDAKEHDNTTDPLPGVPGDPLNPGEYPGKGLGDPSPPPKPVEKTLEELKDVATNPESTGEDVNTAKNTATAAQVHEVKAQQDIIHKAKDVANNLFDGGLFGSEKAVKGIVIKTIGDAIKSDDPEQFAAAKEIMDSLSVYGKDKETGRPYNKDNTFNELAGFSGDVINMLAKLKEIIYELNNFEIKVKQE